MRILLDFYTTQFFIGGAGEYIRRIFYTLLEEPEVKNGSIELYGLIDTSQNKFAYADLAPEALQKKGVIIADCKNEKLSGLVQRLKIDTFFIGAGQYVAELLRRREKLDCRIVCVIHDLFIEEFNNSRLEEYLDLEKLPKMVWNKSARAIYNKVHWNNLSKRISNLINSINLDHTEFIVVSDYTRSTLLYHYGISGSHVHTLYSPARIPIHTEKTENSALQKLVNQHIPYLLMVSANRAPKNADKLIRAFIRYTEESHNNIHLVTIGYKKSKHARHIILPYLSEGDLDVAMQNCYALVYPSFFEGFGYPPIEAMRYGKPVIAAYSTSIPEILQDSALYVSPIYESDMFRGMMRLNDSSLYQELSNKAVQRYTEVHNRQERDLRTLIDIIKNNG